MMSMLDKDQILTMAVILSILGISGLYLFTSQQTTKRVLISEIDEAMKGSRVVTEGFVSDVGWFSWTVVLTLREPGDTRGLTVAFDRELADDLGADKREIRPGAKLKVEGKLEEYEGDLNLRVDSMGQLSVEKKAYSSFIEISSLLENPRWYEGMGVKVRGDIIDMAEFSNHTTFVISDFEGGGYELTSEIKYWSPQEEVLGKPTVLKGYWEYDNTVGSWKLVSHEVPDISGIDH